MSIFGLDIAWFILGGIVICALMAAFHLGRWHMIIEVMKTEHENDGIINDDFSHIKRNFYAKKADNKPSPPTTGKL